MAGNILSRIRTDARKIVNSLGFETDIIITQGESEPITVKGLGMVHHIAFDTEGRTINSKQAHITVHENDLTGLTVRTTKGDVYLRGCIVEFADSTGVVKKYNVKENYADETIGIIVLILDQYVS